MLNFKVFVISAVMVSSGVDCRYWSQSTQSITREENTRTISEIDDNGKKEIINCQFGRECNRPISNNQINCGVNNCQQPEIEFNSNVDSISKIAQQQMQIQMQRMETEFRQRQQQFMSSYQNSFPANNQFPSYQQNANNPNGRFYSFHSTAFSNSSIINGVENRKEGATTTINDNGKIATYSTGDRA